MTYKEMFFVLRTKEGDYRKFKVSSVQVHEDGSPVYKCMDLILSAYVIFDLTDNKVRKMAILEESIPEATTAVFDDIRDLVQYLAKSDDYNVHLREGCRRWVDRCSNKPEPENKVGSLTLLNLTGDITITWDESNDEKIKDLVRKKMKEGYTFFTMRKVVIEAIQIRRKVGEKGVDSLKSLIIDDDTFERMVEDMDDRDLAETLRSGTGRLAKRKGHTGAAMDGLRQLRKDEEVKGKQLLGVRPIAGG